MKTKITSAFNNMNLKSSKDALSWSNEQEAHFGLTGHGREAIGTLILGPENTIITKVYLTTYSVSYFKEKLSKFFKAENIRDYEITFENEWPVSGDIVNTQFDASDLDEGDEILLKADIKFYSYGDLPVSCNGYELGIDFDAEFLGNFQKTCIGSPYGHDNYSKFRLL